MGTARAGTGCCGGSATGETQVSEMTNSGPSEQSQEDTCRWEVERFHLSLKWIIVTAVVALAVILTSLITNQFS
jgi:hypothetical protein